MPSRRFSTPPWCPGITRSTPRALLRPRRRRGALPLLTRTWEFRTPVGVVGFFVPWNYPLNLAITDAVPALMAGNTGVLKPDPQTSFTALWAVELLREAGLPPDVLPVVTGEGPVIGPALVERVDYVMFTGSVRTGRMVGSRAAERLIGCSLELGGKNPMIVLEDADLEAAVDGAVNGCFVGAGQVCISIERIYVHESLFEAFVRRFAERTKSLRLGAALDYSVDVGSLTSGRQLEAVEQHVRDALEKGATLAAGGRRRPDLGPLFYEPTILTNVREGMQLYAEETFGPVVSVYPFRDEEDAIARANATRYGLSASIWTRSTPTGHANGAQDPQRQRQRERSVRRGLGIGRFTHRRHERIRDTPAARRRGHSQIHTAADGGGPTVDAGRSGAGRPAGGSRTLDDAPAKDRTPDSGAWLMRQSPRRSLSFAE